MEGGIEPDEKMAEGPIRAGLAADALLRVDILDALRRLGREAAPGLP